MLLLLLLLLSYSEVYFRQSSAEMGFIILLINKFRPAVIANQERFGLGNGSERYEAQSCELVQS